MKVYDFYPAKLVMGARWYVEFYQTNPSTGLKERTREYHQLNRIKDINERYLRGLRIVKNLNENLLINGYPFDQQLESPDMTVLDGLKLAVSIKSKISRVTTSPDIMLATIPIVSVTANPCTGPVPKIKRMIEVIMVVKFESKMALKAL